MRAGRVERAGGRADGGQGQGGGGSFAEEMGRDLARFIVLREEDGQGLSERHGAGSAVQDGVKGVYERRFDVRCPWGLGKESVSSQLPVCEISRESSGFADKWPK